MNKNLLAVALLIGAATTVSAQSTFGLRAGLNLATEYAKQNNQSSTTKIAPSFHIAGYYDARVSQGFSIQPGLSLQGKGGKSDLNGETLTDKLLYVEVPVNFLGRVQAGNGEVFFGGGPYLAYGVSARVTSGRNAQHLEFGNDPDQLKPFDAGLGFMTGYKFFNGLVLSLSSSAGFVNIGNIEGTTFQNRVMSFSIGYEFSKR